MKTTLDKGVRTMSETVPEPAGAAEAAVPFDPERIIAELNSGRRHLPEGAIREARLHRDVMVPRLIQTIQNATAKVRAGDNLEGNARFFALFLLGEFKAREGLPAILEAISLPGEQPSELFGDAITTVLAGILVTLSDDPLTLIDELIRNTNLNEYVRWEAAQAYVHLVRDGRLRREEAVEFLRRHLRRELDGEDESEILTPLVSTLCDLAPKEAYKEIKEAFGRHEVDEFMINLAEVDCSITEGDAGVQRQLNGLEVLNDTIEELRHWAAFQPEPAPQPRRTPIPWPGESKPRPDRPALPPEIPLDPPSPLAASKRVGRNDPCPCGSGKKYKKCCLDKDR
ncbi:MAG: DUF1186 domain-containing protein [Tepidisphaerales bacterium]